MRTVLYPGSFDPVTAGHLDIIQRASVLFDRVIVGVLHNPQKPTGAFTVAQRIAFLQAVTAPLKGVAVQAMTGLLVDAAQACGADAVLRGIRTAADVESELQMARLNRQVRGTETVFIAAAPHLIHVSANFVRDIGRLGGDLHGLVPEAIRPQVADILGKQGP